MPGEVAGASLHTHVLIRRPVPVGGGVGGAVGGTVGELVGNMGGCVEGTVCASLRSHVFSSRFVAGLRCYMPGEVGLAKFFCLTRRVPRKAERRADLGWEGRCQG